MGCSSTLKSLKSLVTGGAGFIGSNLVDQLLLGIGDTVEVLIMKVLMPMINLIGIAIQSIFVEISEITL